MAAAVERIRKAGTKEKEEKETKVASARVMTTDVTIVMFVATVVVIVGMTIAGERKGVATAGKSCCVTCVVMAVSKPFWPYPVRTLPVTLGWSGPAALFWIFYILRLVSQNCLLMYVAPL